MAKQQWANRHGSRALRPAAEVASLGRGRRQNDTQATVKYPADEVDWRQAALETSNRCDARCGQKYRQYERCAEADFVQDRPKRGKRQRCERRGRVACDESHWLQRCRGIGFQECPPAGLSMREDAPEAISSDSGEEGGMLVDVIFDDLS